MRWGGKVGMKMMMIVTVNSDKRESDREVQKLIGNGGGYIPGWIFIDIYQLSSPVREISHKYPLK